MLTLLVRAMSQERLPKRPICSLRLALGQQWDPRMAGSPIYLPM